MVEALDSIVQIDPAKFGPLVQDIDGYVRTKHWCELGEKILELISDERLNGQYEIIYENFIKMFFEALEQLVRARIILQISTEMMTDKALEFLTNMLENFQKFPEQDLLKLRIVFLHTERGEFEIALNLLNEIESNINDDTPLYLRAQFHRTQADLDKARGDFDAFYEHALLFLSTSGITDNHVLAFDLCMAALCSSRVCAFGELAAHPILNSLRNTPNEWLANLIMLLNSGETESIPEFNEKFAPVIQANDTFRAFLPIIQQKLALSVFLQLIFSRPFNTRVFSFSEISQTCHVAMDRVEILIMKALSADLVRGEIDQVDETLTVTWCRPKALDRARLIHLRTELGRWHDIVAAQKNTLAARAQPVVG